LSRRRGPYHRRAVNLPGTATVLWSAHRAVFMADGEGVQAAATSQCCGRSEQATAARATCSVVYSYTFSVA